MFFVRTSLAKMRNKVCSICVQYETRIQGNFIVTRMWEQSVKKCSETVSVILQICDKSVF